MDTDTNAQIILNPQTTHTQVQTHKVCSTCKKTKPVEDFYANKASPDGLQAACKPCLQEYQKEYRRKHAAEVAAKAKAQSQARAKATAKAPTAQLVSDPQYAQSIASAAQLMVAKGVPVKAAFELAVDLAENGLIIRAI